MQLLMRPIFPLPIPVKNALRKLGSDIQNARLRRRIPMKLMAERASISRTTLTKVEKGDPYVSIGRVLEEENLPYRIRLPRNKPRESKYE